MMVNAMYRFAKLLIWRGSRKRSVLHFGAILILAASAARGGEPIKIVATGIDASFRAITVSASRVFVGGTQSTLLRSDDAGKTWKPLNVSDDTELDFRDIEALADGTLVVMSAGPGQKSQLFRSVDHGESWSNVWINKQPAGFFNGIAVAEDGKRVVLVGDPIDSKLFVLRSVDAGQTWHRLPGPKVDEGEYGFAASGTGIQLAGDNAIVIATGGSRARVFRSVDDGKSWTSAETQLQQGENGTESAGVFSIAIRERRAVVVGGDYRDPSEDVGNAAWSNDAGKSWTISKSRVPHKACVRFLDESRLLAAGRTGIMASFDAGETWHTLSRESFYTIAIDHTNRQIFLAGAKGRTATLTYASIIEEPKAN